MTRRLAAAMTALVLAATSCGVPLDAQPEVIASEDLPRSLQPGLVDTTTSSTLPILESEIVTIYLIDPADGNARLVPVDRQVPQGGSRTDVEEATLQHLLAGPSNEEQLEDNLTTLVIPSGDDPISVVGIQHPAPEQIAVVLSEPPALEGSDRVAAFAQIVFTLTQFPDTNSVLFLVRNSEGEDTVIPVKTDTEEGDVTRPVGRQDYSTLQPEPGTGDI